MKNRLGAACSLLIVCTLMLTACSGSKVSMEHVHGLGYTGDGTQILIPAHDGLVAYSGGKWQHVDAPKHDYMGFVTVDDGFYSSGHPGPGTSLKNPLGVVKSADLGKSLTKLDLEGVSDFHSMTAGYKTHVLYVFNEQPNARMKTAGLYYTKDEAKTWTKSDMNGVTEEPVAIAAHPTDDKTIAIGAKDGVYISRDSGNRFERLAAQPLVTALMFGNGGELFVASAKPNVMLQIQPDTKEKKEIKLPGIDSGDAIAYIAQNPKDSKEIAIATYSKDVFVSKDSGSAWSQIADQGKGK